MKNDKVLRQHLLNALKGDGAHADFATAVNNVPADLRGKRPNGAEHSAWEVLEHLRIAQWDILEYIKDAKHASPEFPSGYWPAAPAPPDEKAWDKSVKCFQKDFEAAIQMASNEGTDLLAPLHGDPEQTIFRKLLMLADHNSYHLGEMVLLRRVLGGW